MRLFTFWKYLCEILLLLSIFVKPSKAVYTAEEFAFIPWGDEAHQLPIELPAWVDFNNTPFDSTDDLMEEPPGGPSQSFVDRFENIYISSYSMAYLKAFDSTGRLILDFSMGTPAYDSIMNGANISEFFVDSLCRIYILAFPPQEYVAVIDTLGNLIDKLNPMGLNSGVNVCAMDYGSHDILTVCLCNNQLFTYESGHFSQGGSLGWKAVDGYYYHANFVDSTTIRFIKYSNPDINGDPPDLQETFLSYSPYFFSAGSKGVDDSMRIFLGMFASDSTSRVRIYDTAYQLLDEIVYTPSENKYYQSLGSFMRPDGNLYQFRFLDDGLHVIRWSKQ